MKTTIFHKDYDGCGQLAFYSFAGGAHYGTVPSSCVDDLEYPDGSKPGVGEVLKCFACGRDWVMQVKSSVILVVHPALEGSSTVRERLEETNSSPP